MPLKSQTKTSVPSLPTLGSAWQFQCPSVSPRSGRTNRNVNEDLSGGPQNPDRIAVVASRPRVAIADQAVADSGVLPAGRVWEVDDCFAGRLPDMKLRRAAVDAVDTPDFIWRR